MKQFARVLVAEGQLVTGSVAVSLLRNTCMIFVIDGNAEISL